MMLIENVEGACALTVIVYQVAVEPDDFTGVVSLAVAGFHGLVERRVVVEATVLAYPVPAGPVSDMTIDLLVVEVVLPVM